LFLELNELEHDINLRKILWKSIEEWDILIKKWLSNLIDDIKVDVVQKEVNKFTQNIYMLEKGLPPNELVPRLKIKVLDFKKALPIIVALRNQNLKFRHYQQIKHLIGIDLKDESKKFTLSILLDVDVIFKIFLIN
jgi:dynein heavy chain